LDGDLEVDPDALDKIKHKMQQQDQRNWAWTWTRQLWFSASLSLNKKIEIVNQEKKEIFKFLYGELFTPLAFVRIHLW